MTTATLVSSFGGGRLEPGDAVDLVVVGAGITGVQVAREAALRGRSVLLVDRGDLGGGTSSATTKYLHGGIRYLEQHDVAVVRHSLRERRIMALAAPHLVRQMPFVLPAWSWSRPGATLLGAGALAYDALSFDRNRHAPGALRIGHPRWLSKRRALAAVPWLDPTDLRGAVMITDTLNVHPERLLLELATDAVDHGAIVRTYTAVTGFTFAEPDADGRRAVTGVTLADTLDGTSWTVATGAVVNAGGPWIAEVLAPLAANGRPIGPRVTPSKGVHLLTTARSPEHPRRPAEVAVMARVRNGRHVVVSPWSGREFIGPTDTPVTVSPSDVSAAPGDVDELLAITNGCSTTAAALTRADVDDVTVGIRPLVSTTTATSSSDHGDADDADDADDAAPTYTASRRHHLFDHAAEGFGRLWTVAGGKWTTGRATAEAVVDEVFAGGRTGGVRSRLRFGHHSPSRERAVGAASGFGDDPATVFEIVRRHRRGAPLDAGQRQHLARLYGLRASAIVDLCAENPALAAPISARPDCHDVAAQVVAAVATEGARRLSDIVDRRLVIGTLGRMSAAELATVAAIAAPLLGWSDGGAAEAADEHARRERRRRRWGAADR